MNHIGSLYKFNILLTEHLVKAIQTHARLILTPYFQEVAITNTENESGQSYPILTPLAERIISQVYQDGELSFSSQEKAKVIALTFVKKLREWERECLAFYFCTNDTFIEKLDEEGPSTFLNDVPEESWDQETCRIITQSIRSISQDEEQLSKYVVLELVNLQDIFSIEDTHSWDASSIAYANENFNSYTGSTIKLIPLPDDDFEYWNTIIEHIEDDDDDEDEEVDDEDYNPFM